MADSLLNAAKKLAVALDMEWKDIQPIYTDLLDKGDGKGLLPKSSGRQVWAAHPHYISRLIVAIGLRSEKLSGKEAVLLTWCMTPSGRDLFRTESVCAQGLNLIEKEFAQYLLYPDVAETLDYVEFDAAEKSIKFVQSDGKEKLFLPDNGNQWKDDDLIFPKSVAAVQKKETGSRLQMRAILSGEAIQDMASTIEWRTQDQPPFQHTTEN